MNLGEYARQVDLFDPTRHTTKNVVVVGAGTIGSWTVLGLAKLGVQNITVYDPDCIEIQNTSNQLYAPSDVGSSKVLLLQNHVLHLTDRHINIVPQLYGHAVDPRFTETILIVTVDSMESRRLIYEMVELTPKISYYIDARTGGEVARIFCFNPRGTINRENYRKTLHSEVPPEGTNPDVIRLSAVPCTAQSIVDVSMFVASKIVNSVRRYLTNKESPFGMNIDLSNNVWIEE